MSLRSLPRDAYFVFVFLSASEEHRRRFDGKGAEACPYFVCSQIFADQLAKLASGLRTDVSLRKNLEYATSHED
jgi:hypothetical protein